MSISHFLVGTFHLIWILLGLSGLTWAIRKEPELVYAMIFVGLVLPIMFAFLGSHMRDYILHITRVDTYLLARWLGLGESTYIKGISYEERRCFIRQALSFRLGRYPQGRDKIWQIQVVADKYLQHLACQLKERCETQKRYSNDLGDIKKGRKREEAYAIQEALDALEIIGLDIKKLKRRFWWSHRIVRLNGLRTLPSFELYAGLKRHPRDA